MKISVIFYGLLFRFPYTALAIRVYFSFFFPTIHHTSTIFSFKIWWRRETSLVRERWGLNRETSSENELSHAYFIFPSSFPCLGSWIASHGRNKWLKTYRFQLLFCLLHSLLKQHIKHTRPKVTLFSNCLTVYALCIRRAVFCKLNKISMMHIICTSFSSSDTLYLTFLTSVRYLTIAWAYPIQL